MRAILTSTGRSLLRHWPALLAWYLGGILVHFVVVEAAGFVGAYSATVGLLILPVAILARLVSMVAMFLVLRDGLVELGVIAPLPAAARERRRAFTAALLASILPFVAIYWGQGMLKEDVDAYSRRALQELSNRHWLEESVNSADTALEVSLTVWTALIIAVAFLARWAWGRWSERVPAWLTPLAVYFEVVWIFFSLLVIGDLTDSVRSWVDTRAAVAFFDGLRETILGAIAPLAWAWDAVLWLIGQMGPILLAPLAWLTVAGVVYGQAIVAEKLTVELGVLERIRKRTDAVPSALMRRLKDLSGQFTGRFRPIGRALLLMWRAGPVLIASYAFFYIGVKALESYLQFGITRLVGPHDMIVWTIALPLVSLVPMLLIEPLRISVIAAAYDATLGKLRKYRQDAEPAVQGSNVNLSKESSPTGSMSTQNGPVTSSGTTNPTTS